MKPKITMLDIKQFRSFRQLTLEGLGLVTLITGKNNTGKSSVLEALRILASEASLSVIYSILSHREEDFGENRQTAPVVDAEGLFPLSSLFNGFPRFSSQIEPIVIGARGKQRSMKISLKAIWASEEREENGSRRYIPVEQEHLDEAGVVPALLIQAGEAKRVFLLENMGRLPYRTRILRPEITDEPRLPCVFVSPYGGERTSHLGSLWDRIALSDSESDVIEALQIIDPDISGISMIGGEGSIKTRTAIVRSKRLPRPVPLRSFGDGMNRLFGIVLSLVSARDGILLIDEFENGLHHSIQVDVWRAIFRLAGRLDAQVVATSHSWDAIESFQKAASEVPEEAALMSLSRKGDAVVPTLFREEEVAVVTRDRIEVR